MSDKDDIEYLYKYRSLSRDSIERVEKILLQNEVYFSRPQDFNDPFDCLPITNLNASIDIKTDYLKNVFRTRMPHLTRGELRARVRNALKESSKKEKKTALDEALAQTFHSVGVFSLSAKCDHLLMWAHYADSHHGICLRFRASSTTPFFGGAQRVTYQAERPILNVFSDSPQEKIDKAALTKADFWEYEEEWRIIDHERGPGVRRFPAELLDGVILGARISLENRQKVEGWASKRKVRTELLQARISPKLFRIEISAAA